jgi:tyrosyl-tRNA synthetase
MQNVIECLQSRGLIDALTSEELFKAAEAPLKVYVGFDPTSDSLHLGNLMGIVLLKWFQLFGHRPFVILGGATGKIGDPSGKSSERPLLDEKTLIHNIAGIRKNFERILDFSDARTCPVILNNEEWISQMSFVDFLRDVGKHFRIGPMLAKDSVRSRFESEEGMSFTEFSYQLLQAYDFYHLFETKQVALQMGGSDQWGNITAGLDLIRKLKGKSAYGLTFPLLTRSDGKKFGKSEEGAIWLSPEKLSPYQFYQYLVRVPDADVIKLMAYLTFIEMEEIENYKRQMEKSDYIPNTAQKRLAAEITRLVHGEEGLQTALRVTEAASPGSKAALDPSSFKEIAKDMPNIKLSSNDVIGQRYVDLAVRIGLLSSKSEASRLIENEGAYLNNEKIKDVDFRIQKDHLVGEKYLLFGAGKKKKMLIELK